MAAIAKEQQRQTHTWRRYPSYKPSGVEWLGEVPEHFQITPIKRFVKIRYGLGEPPKELETGLPILRATNIDQGKIVDEGMMYVDPKDVPALRDAYLRENEIIIVRSGANTGDSTIVPKRYAGSVSGYDMVVTVKTGVPEYFAWQFLTPEVRDLQFGFYKLRAAQPHLNAEELGNTIFIFAPLPEQTTIAAFLNCETARIDSLITKKQRQIELLHEKRAALISHAVTKGLDPSAPMKDSGIEWLGMVPEGWKISKIKWLSSKIGSGKTPRGGSEIYQDSGILFIRSQNVHFNGLILDDIAFISHEIDEEMVTSRVRSSDILLNITGASLGRCTIVPENLPSANVNQHVCIVRSIRERIFPEYLNRYLSSSIAQWQIFRSEEGVSREGLNYSQISNIVVIIPPLMEQKKIYEYLNFECTRINTIMEKIQVSIGKLQEYRSTLISAAVTGKIDVRQDGEA